MASAPGRTTSSKAPEYTAIQVAALMNLADHLKALKAGEDNGTIFQYPFALPLNYDPLFAPPGLEAGTERGDLIAEFFQQKVSGKCAITSCRNVSIGFQVIMEHYRDAHHDGNTVYVCVADGCRAVVVTATKAAGHSVNVHGGAVGVPESEKKRKRFNSLLAVVNEEHKKHCSRGSRRDTFAIGINFVQQSGQYIFATNAESHISGRILLFSSKHTERKIALLL